MSLTLINEINSLKDIKETLKNRESFDVFLNCENSYKFFRDNLSEITAMAKEMGYRVIVVDPSASSTAKCSVIKKLKLYPSISFKLKETLH